MRVMLCVALLGATVSAQGAGEFSGTWRAVDQTMGARTEAVPSPLDLRKRSVPPPVTRELVLTQRPDAVDVRRPDAAGTWSLPLTGVAVQTVDRAGNAVMARAVREGEVLVIRTEQRVQLPGGPEVGVETEDRHVLLADGSLQVTSTARAGGLTQTRQLTYQRVP